MSLTDAIVDQMKVTARELGAQSGKSAASWVFDGNTEDGAYVLCVKMADAGDPEWWGHYGPVSGPLSGEYADAPSARWLAAQVDLEDDDDPTGDVLADVGDAFEESFNSAWHDEVMRVARYHA